VYYVLDKLIQRRHFARYASYYKPNIKMYFI